MTVKNAVPVDYRGERKGELYIEDGLFAERGGGEVIDARGLHVLPAFVDLHTHLRAPGLEYKEDVTSGCRAAVRGGYTTLNAMANTNPVCSNAEIARAVALQARSLGLCDVFQCVSATENFDGRTVSHLDRLDGTEDYIKCISEDGYGIADSGVFLEVLRRAEQRGKTLLIHAEDASLSAVDMYAAEDLETIRDLYLVERFYPPVALATSPFSKGDKGEVLPPLSKGGRPAGSGGFSCHFCHVSTAYSARAIIAAKRRGAPVTFEVTPHHLALNDETIFRVNPPLRRESDRAFLVKAVLDGDADIIATDHAPHTAEDKLNGAAGMVGLETAFQVCYTVLCRQNGLPLPRLTELMSRNPAKILGINKGSFETGRAGDVVLVDLSREVTADSSEFFSKGRNTPFDGRKYYGKVIMTIKGGEVVYNEH